MPYTFTLTTTIPASAQDIYDAWLDSLAHSEMTGGEANMSDEIGAEVSAWDGYISGRNLELVPGERIVQSWRSSKFADEHEDSIITITLQEVDGGTLLTLEHSNVPDEQRSYEEGGWQENYFEPMVAFFAERKPAPAARPVKNAASKPASKGRRGRAAKSEPKPKRAKGSRTKRVAPRKKSPAARSKRKPSRNAPAAGRRKRATAVGRRPAHGKRK
jgi:uncharacterized protein YndB with AHSA1/START domain